MTTHTEAPRYVPRVSVYFTDRGMRTMTIAQALAVADEAVVILGAMRPGYLGRESLTADDLSRWLYEDEEAAVWREVDRGQRLDAE